MFVFLWTARALQTLLEDELEDSLEPTIGDFLPKAENAFTKLLTDSNNMRVSNLLRIVQCLKREQYVIHLVK